MWLKYSISNKNLVNTLFVSILIPYLLLCLTMGGFHDSIFSARHCNHAQEFVSNYTECQQIRISGSASQHNSETCQICQWLKTPSSLVQFLSLDTYFGCVCINPAFNYNPVIPPLSIHKFTIRPPPSFSCFLHNQII